MEPEALAGETVAVKFTPSLNPDGFSEGGQCDRGRSKSTVSEAMALVLEPPDAVATTK